MPTISPTAAAPPAPVLGGSGNADLGRDEFLQLLVAQLRNQDPTSPQSGHEFAAQLAQFSSVEQLTKISASMDAQAGQFAALAEAIEGVRAGQAAAAGELSGRIDLQAASGLIGRTVEVASPAVELGEGGAAVAVRLGGAAREVEVTVRDASGAVVRTLRTGPLAAGDREVAWDGARADGSAAAPGAYTVEVRAVGADGGPVEAVPVRRGVVDRVAVEAGGVSLWVGGRAVPFAALLAVVGSGSDAGGPDAGGPDAGGPDAAGPGAGGAVQAAAARADTRPAFLPLP